MNYVAASMRLPSASVAVELSNTTATSLSLPSNRLSIRSISASTFSFDGEYALTMTGYFWVNATDSLYCNWGPLTQTAATHVSHTNISCSIPAQSHTTSVSLWLSCPVDDVRSNGVSFSFAPLSVISSDKSADAGGHGRAVAGTDAPTCHGSTAR